MKVLLLSRYGRLGANSSFSNTFPPSQQQIMYTDLVNINSDCRFKYLQVTTFFWGVGE